MFRGQKRVDVFGVGAGKSGDVAVESPSGQTDVNCAPGHKDVPDRADESRLPQIFRLVDAHVAVQNMGISRRPQTDADIADEGAGGDGEGVDESGREGLQRFEEDAESAEVQDGNCGQDHEGEDHEEAHEHVGDADGQEAAGDAVENDDSGREKKALERGHAETRRQGFSAGRELGGEIGGHEDEDGDGGDDAKRMRSVLEARFEIVGNGDVVHPAGEAAQAAAGVEEKKKLHQDVADDGPDGRNTPGEGQARHADEKPGRAARGHGGQGDDEGFHAAAAQEKGPDPGRREADRDEADDDHQDEIDQESGDGPGLGPGRSGIHVLSRPLKASQKARMRMPSGITTSPNRAPVMRYPVKYR